MQTLRLVAVKFSFVNDKDHASFQNIPFYTEHLPTFLRQHQGSIVWVKGGHVRREAFLIFSEEIQPSLRTLFTELNKVGIPFSITSVRDPNQLYRESLLEKRDTIGLLKLGDKQLGYGLSEGETPSRLKSPCFIHAKTQNCIYQLTFSAAFEKTLVGGEIISHDSEDRPETWVHLINVVETVDCRADYHAEYPERYLRFSSVSRV